MLQREVRSNGLTEAWWLRPAPQATVLMSFHVPNEPLEHSILHRGQEVPRHEPLDHPAIPKREVRADDRVEVKQRNVKSPTIDRAGQERRLRARFRHRFRTCILAKILGLAASACVLSGFGLAATGTLVADLAYQNVLYL